jgi:protein-L-isoaspartate(D-aspartate) O-methyltransferase
MSRSARDSLLKELRRAIADERVLDAIAAVPREAFVPGQLRDQAYENVALPIAHGQTISQPLVVARMLELLEVSPEDRVLDIGTGSGYHAALLAVLGAHVWTVERYAALSARAAAALAQLRIANVTCVVGDGTGGLPEEAPFDAINVAAGAAAVPAALEEQLAPGGRLVLPIGGDEQHLVRVDRTPQGWRRERHEAVRFVPLVTD